MRLPLFGAHRQGEAVDVDILLRDAVRCAGTDDLFGDAHPFFRRFGDAVLVHRQPHHRRAVLFHHGQDGGKDPVFAVDGVDDRLARVYAQRRLDGVRLAAVYLYGKVGYRLHRLYQFAKSLFFVDLRKACVDV